MKPLPGTLASIAISVALAAVYDARATQPAPPDTEIFLARFRTDGDRFTIGVPANISKSPGYDNQPAFTPDGRTVLFTSARGSSASGAPERGPATDIYAYDLSSSSIRQITRTPESEYSPTVTPDGRSLSVVRVERDGTQRVWRFTLEGRDPSVVLPQVKRVGYHVWIDRRRLAVFVLGEPPTLQVADTSGVARVVASGIGRSLQRIPNGGISFVRVEHGPQDERTLTIMELDPATNVTRVLIAAVAGATEADLAWTPDGTLLMAHRGTLYAWRRGGDTWQAAADLAALGLHNVTRIAISAAGDHLAMVASPQPR